MSESPEFDGAIQKLDEAYRDGLRAFADWFAVEWQMKREDWAETFAEPLPTGDYFDGFNAGVGSVKDALSGFLDEYRP